MIHSDETFDHDIAIVGMAGRFPGANDIEEFWRKLCAGVESITFFSDSELLARGVPKEHLADPHYVKAQAYLDDIEFFDANFFGYSAREAEILDPQQRVFLEESWHALEHAGYNPETYRGRIGVYAGTKLSFYLLWHINTHPEIWNTMGSMQVVISNDKDTIAARVAYKLNLKGPALNVQTACSTSLVAVHLACQSLLNGENDLALAGGVSISLPQKQGYFYHEGSIGSPDGHCRAFDAQSQGTVVGSGVGVVVLKRLTSALTDGDTIYAVIKGSAINNDGAQKVGFTAPGVDGQAEVIADALALAGVNAADISYIEAHGTGTTLGDPIEITALKRAYQAYTTKKQYCAIGSLKTNIGHLDSASGVAGLIKTALALKHQLLPPSLHFKQPNPAIDFANSPFYVNTQLAPWSAQNGPRLAGVSSFGIGGTNAHVILSEAPIVEATAPVRPWQLLVFSAKAQIVLENKVSEMIAFLKASEQTQLADLAYTSQVGRALFSHRLICLCQDHEDALHVLENRTPGYVFAFVEEEKKRPVAFLFPGQGAQYAQMGAELYQHEPTFRMYVERCAQLFQTHLGFDIRANLYAEQQTSTDDLQNNSAISIIQPALFTVEYALAQLWMAWGIRPRAMLGHSIGEYVAACLAGVFSLEDGIALIAARSRLMEETEAGAMLSVSLTEQEILPLLTEILSLAAINAPELCTVSGPLAALETFKTQLVKQDVQCRLLHVPVAAHSTLMEPLLARFLAAVQQVPLHAPQLPYLSNVTGTWITEAEATDPHYWVRHLRQTVRFSDDIVELLKIPDLACLEVGPGHTLSTLARQQQHAPSLVVNSMAHVQDTPSDERVLMEALGKLWLVGVPVDWAKFSAHKRQQRIAMPLYPFNRQRYWIEAAKQGAIHESLPMGGQEYATNAHEVQEQRTSLSLHTRPDLLTAYVAPTNTVEQAITDVWEKALGVGPIGIHDDFFELGGHSLLVTQIAFQLRQIFPLELSLRNLYMTKTVAQMASVIEELLIEKIEELSEEEVERFL